MHVVGVSSTCDYVYIQYTVFLVSKYNVSATNLKFNLVNDKFMLINIHDQLILLYVPALVSDQM